MASVYALGFVGASAILNRVPHPGGGVVLAAQRVGVNLGSGANRGVPEAFGDRHQIHAVVQQLARVAVAQERERVALGLG